MVMVTSSTRCVPATVHYITFSDHHQRPRSDASGLLNARRRYVPTAPRPPTPIPHARWAGSTTGPYLPPTHTDPALRVTHRPIARSNPASAGAHQQAHANPLKTHPPAAHRQPDPLARLATPPRAGPADTGSRQRASHTSACRAMGAKLSHRLLLRELKDKLPESFVVQLSSQQRVELVAQLCARHGRAN